MFWANCDSIFTGYDAQNRRECNPLMKENEEWAKKWETHLDLHLPRTSKHLLPAPSIHTLFQVELNE
jgi:hypothetical protein